MKRPLPVMDMNIHVINIYEDGVPNTASMSRETCMPTETHGTTRKAQCLDLSARTTAIRDTCAEHSGPLEYVRDKVVDHRYTSKDLQ